MKIISILLIVLFSYPNTEPKPTLECADFKNGIFELISTITNKRYIIKRYGSSQTEECYDLKSDALIGISTFKVIWVNDCEYNLLIDKTEGTYDKADLLINSKGGINTKILSIENTCATIRFGIEKFTIEGKLCKIE